MIYFSPYKDIKVFFVYFHPMNRLFLKYWFVRIATRIQSFSKSPFARKWEHKHPQLFRFIVLRFDPQHFRGLPLSLLMFGMLLNAFVLSSLAEELRELSKLKTIDMDLANYFFLHRNEQVANTAYAFTRLGSSPAVLTVLAIFTVLMLWNNRFHALISLLSVLLVSSCTAFTAKLYYRLPRPSDIAWYEEFSYSFPSGHATLAMSFYGFLFYLIIMHFENKVLKRVAFLGAACFILGMGFSRIYLGVHYLSDVFSGFAIGFVWLVFAMALLGWLDFRKEIRRKKGESIIFAN